MDPHTNDFRYVTYIRSTPEKVWEALTTSALIHQYWGIHLHSDWQEGATMTWTIEGVQVQAPEQVVLAAQKPTELRYRWHTITREFAQAVNLPEAAYTTMSEEPLSTASFSIEAHNETTCILRLTHGGFPPQSTIRTMIEEGWPPILSSLKTLLETGNPLPLTPLREPR